MASRLLEMPHGAGDGNRTRMTSLEGCWLTLVSYLNWPL
jgi:hypothetical protein